MYQGKNRVWLRPLEVETDDPPAIIVTYSARCKSCGGLLGFIKFSSRKAALSYLAGARVAYKDGTLRLFNRLARQRRLTAAQRNFLRKIEARVESK